MINFSRYTVMCFFQTPDTVASNYQLENVYELPNTKKSRLTFPLNFPLRIFGKDRPKITVPS